MPSLKIMAAAAAIAVAALVAVPVASAAIKTKTTTTKLTATKAKAPACTAKKTGFALTGQDDKTDHVCQNQVGHKDSHQQHQEAAENR